MKRKNPSYKYQCDNKLKIYSESPLNRSQYYRILNNARPRYMNDYYKSQRYNGKRDDKNFNGILNKYYNDYNKIKNKYNVIEDEPIEKEYTNYNNFDYNEYENRKNNLNYLFFSYDSLEVDENTLDLTDSLVNDMYNGNEDSLLKNTQIKNDYNKRLEEENEIEAPSNHQTISTHSKKGIYYINEKLDDENENRKKNEPPIYEDDKKEEEENETKLKDKQNDIINEEKENENENELDTDKKSLRESEEKKNKEDKEYILMLENNNNNDDELMMFEDIISNNFRKYYNPPYYKIPEYILKEMEKEKEEKIEKDEEYEKYKDQNIVNKDKDGNIQKLEDIIKEDNKNPQLEQIIDPYNKIQYPPQNPQNNTENEVKEKEEEKEKEKENDKNSEYDGGFELVDDEMIRNNSNVINNEVGNDNIKENKISENKEKKENEKEETSGKLDNYKGIDYPNEGEMASKESNEKNEKEGNNDGKELKRNIKYREERFESIPVDDIEDEIVYEDYN